MKPFILSAAAVMLVSAGPSSATTTLFTQAATPRASATPFEVSATFWPDGLDSDYRAWDNFLLPGAATVTGLRWQGQAPAAFDPQSSFDIAFYTDISSIPYNLDVLHYTLSSVLQPDVGAGPAKTYTVGAADFSAVPDGTRADTWNYSVDFRAGQGLALDGQRSYWVTVEAHQTNGNGWSMATGVGDGKSFVRGPAFYAGDVSYFMSNRDLAFSLVGNAAPVPEAASSALLALGLVSLGTLARHRRRSAG